MRSAVKVSFLPLLFLMAACGNSPPEIMNQYWQLNLTEDRGGEDWISREELSFFVLVADEDGPDEVEFLYLIQEEEELFWKLSAENWETQTLGSDEWLGASSLRMSGGEAFPRKTYRILVIDKSGQRSEGEFYLSAKAPADPVFPAGRIEGTVLTLIGPHDVHTLRIYDSGGALIQELKTASREIDLQKLLQEFETRGQGSGAYQLILFADLESQGVTLRSNPILY